ncbi:alginate lyase family protein [Amaricoccus solimangrovi]|uniref:Alginate lyase domain-containing protein n=1 Tax=Amaricoccus solimangrovi TaxID=2589815 RepID=A0A501WRK9_9RHOB|nr:alginate lyase family protein [Amaricoccus solimangrovi]TPE52099.1 hypothetical protein FJM51_06635 [Amaricoccus solimangrovi]
MIRARPARPTRPARRFAARAGLALLALILAATGVAAQEAPDAALPEGVERYTKSRSDCFLPGERRDYDKWIAQFRQPLAGCDVGVIAPPRVIQSHRLYKERSGWIVDCVGMRQKEFATRFIDTYLGEIVSRAEEAETSPAAATCGANMLRVWAEADAMTEIGDGGYEGQSELKISWTFGGLSAAYFIHPKLREAAREIRTADGGTADQEILAWFRKLSGPVSAQIDRERAENNEDNLQYWRGYAILPTAFMTGDAELTRQSRRVFDAALGQVVMGSKDPADDGWLPYEMERGPRALLYQMYATTPVLAMALLSKSEGCGFLAGEEARARLTMMLTRVLEGWSDPTIVSAQVARYGRNGKRLRQIRTGTPRRAARLLYLANQIDPKLYEAVDRNLAAFTGEPSPVFKPTTGAKAGNDRLGGDYRDIAAAAERPGPPPAAIAGVCRAKG